MKIRVALIILSFACCLLGEQTFAFPDTLRHGYTNCTTCHASPSGGGLLNPYGRSLSRELISTWGYQNEEQPLHGLVNWPDQEGAHHLIGGDVRYLERRLDSDRGQDTKERFLMQAQLRFGLLYKQLKFLFSLGSIENPRQSEEVRWVSPEHYVLWNIKDEFSLRAGRFEPIYGLRLADHNLWVKSDFGLSPWMERNSLEFIYESERQFVSVAGFQSTSAMSANQQNTGYSATILQILGERSRVGLSARNSEGQGRRQRALSAHATLSFSEKLFLLTEYGRVFENGSRKEAGFARLGYELHKGVVPYLQAQTRSNQTGDVRQQRYGLGLQWFPRPHFEVQTSIERAHAPAGNFTEALLQLHYYL